MSTRLAFASLAIVLSTSVASATTLLDGVVYEADYSFDVSSDITDSNYLNCLSDANCSVVVTGDPTPVSIRLSSFSGTAGSTLSYQLFDTGGSAVSSLAEPSFPSDSGGNATFGLVGVTDSLL